MLKKERDYYASSVLDGRFVVIGVLLFVISLIVAFFDADRPVRIACTLAIFVSLFAITRRKDKPPPNEVPID